MFCSFTDFSPPCLGVLSKTSTFFPFSKVNNAWNEKIRVEQGKASQLENIWKSLQAKIEANADTPGYQQAIKHNEIQLGQHKNDGPSTRVSEEFLTFRKVGTFEG